MSLQEILAQVGLTGADAARIEGGTDTEIWRVRAGDETYALRLFREGQVARRDREATALRLAASGGVPVPSVRAVAEADSRPALLLDWSPGHPLLEELMGRPDEVASLGFTFGRTQAQIHNAPLEEETGGEICEWIGWGGDLPPDLEAVLRSMATRNNLLHLDYHPLNVVVRGGRITGVIDWANVRIGDRRADLARTRTILQLVRPRRRRPRCMSSLRAGDGATPRPLAGPRGWLRSTPGRATRCSVTYDSKWGRMCSTGYGPGQLSGRSGRCAEPSNGTAREAANGRPLVSGQPTLAGAA